MAMRVAILNYDYVALPTPMHLLARFAPLQWQAEGLREAGAEVHVFQRFHTTQDFNHNGVAYHFWADGLPAELRLTHMPSSLHSAVAQLEPNVVHGHGLVFPLQMAALRRRLPPHMALLLQQHSELPGHPLKRVLQRICFSNVDAFIFPTHGMAAAWQAARIITRQPVHLLQETSREVQPMPQAAARAITGLRAQPALLWMARLVPHKDPLTVLAGFEQAAHNLPGIKLYMGHGNNDLLLPTVRERIAQSEVLARTVVLLGEIPRENLDAYYASADYFVSGSTRYGGIIALLEAMAHGVTPIVTNIEPYRDMTDNGQLGTLWQAGDADSLAKVMLETVRNNLNQWQRARLVNHFHQHLSLSVLAQRAINIYAQVVAARQRRGHYAR